VYSAYHVDDLGQRQSEGDIQRFAGVQRRPYSMVVVAQQITYQTVLYFVTSAYTRTAVIF